MPVSADECARELLHVVPGVMSSIRAELRRNQGGDLSLAEYRTLVYLRGRQDVSLSELAGHIGLGLPSMSKMIDGLVAQRFVSRTEAVSDRRRLALCLTEAGSVKVEGAVAATRAVLADSLAALSVSERQTVFEGLEVLRSAFMPSERVDSAREVASDRSSGTSGSEVSRVGYEDARTKQGIR
jgi:DNA-binding MarR family transcriptional regulator